MYRCKDWPPFLPRLICVSLLSVLTVVLLPACSPQSQKIGFSTQVVQLATAPNQAAPSPTLPPMPTPTHPPYDKNSVRFEARKYQRDVYCYRIFNYQETSYQNVTVAIADNLIEAQDPVALVSKVITHYLNLSDGSPAAMSRPFTVFVIPDPSIGECYSRDHFVFVAPEELDSLSFLEDLLGASAGISEYWVQAGLTALALGKQPDKEALRTWYQNTNELDMAGLFIARFSEDWATEEERKIARMSATSLVRYGLEKENISPDRLAQQVNNEVRTRWLESLGVHRTVTYTYDGRFVAFEYSRSANCSLIAQADTMRFCLNRITDQEYFDEISEAEFLIDYAYYGRKVLAEYVLAQAPSVKPLMDPDEMITIEVSDLQRRLGYTQDNVIRINKMAVYFYPLHEIVHTFDWSESFFRADSVWLSEGFAEYLGRLLPIYPQISKHSIFEDLNGRVIGGDTQYAKYSYWYALDPKQFEAAQAWYQSQGGEIKDEESVDPRLFTDAFAFATMYRDGFGTWGMPIGEKYETLFPTLDWGDLEGLELSYTQAASFVAWLCDTYSMDRVLDVYVNGAENRLLNGKSYAELKAEWQGDLLSKGQGIKIPGST